MWGASVVVWSICVACVVATCFAGYSALNLNFHEDNPCAMSYFKLQIVPFVAPGTMSIPASALGDYSLYRFVDGHGHVRDSSFRDFPVLFVHGSGGKYLQGRGFSSAVNDALKRDRSVALHPDFFSIDFNEVFSALSGDIVLSQAACVGGVALELLSMYPPGAKILFGGHSMGGVVIATAITLGYIAPDQVAGIVVSGAPMKQAVWNADDAMNFVYNQLHNARGSSLLSRIPIVNVAGGIRDHLVAPRLAGLREARENAVAVLSATVPSIGGSIDHQCLCWCDAHVRFLAGVVKQIVVAAEGWTASPLVHSEVRRYLEKHQSIGYPLDETVVVHGFPGFEQSAFPFSFHESVNNEQDVTVERFLIPAGVEAHFHFQFPGARKRKYGQIMFIVENDGNSVLLESYVFQNKKQGIARFPAQYTPRVIRVVYRGGQNGIEIHVLHGEAFLRMLFNSFYSIPTRLVSAGVMVVTLDCTVFASAVLMFAAWLFDSMATFGLDVDAGVALVEFILICTVVTLAGVAVGGLSMLARCGCRDACKEDDARPLGLNRVWSVWWALRGTLVILGMYCVFPRDEVAYGEHDPSGHLLSVPPKMIGVACLVLVCGNVVVCIIQGLYQLAWLSLVAGFLAVPIIMFNWNHPYFIPFLSRSVHLVSVMVILFTIMLYCLTQSRIKKTKKSNCHLGGLRWVAFAIALLTCAHHSVFANCYSLASVLFAVASFILVPSRSTKEQKLD